MTLNAGSILEGTVVNITNFGAFVEIEGKTGLVHISEVSD
ncbi:S1 RNA-binding domain-containing protein, partial [Clostridium botulinum]